MPLTKDKVIKGYPKFEEFKRRVAAGEIQLSDNGFQMLNRLDGELSRWKRPDGGFYDFPVDANDPNDPITRQKSQRFQKPAGPVDPAEAPLPEDSDPSLLGTTARTVGKFVGTPLRIAIGMYDQAGEDLRNPTVASVIGGQMVGQAVKDPSGTLRAASGVTTVDDLTKPTRVVIGEGRPATAEEWDRMETAGADLGFALATGPGQRAIRHMPGKANPVLNPKSAPRLAADRAESAINKTTKKATRYDEVHRDAGAPALEQSKTKLAEARTPAGPPGSQLTAQSAITAADESRRLSKQSGTDTRASFLHREKAMSHLAQRLSPFIEKAEERIKRGDNFSETYYQRYRDEAPHPDRVRKDMETQHAETQALLSTEPYQFQVPAERVVNSVFDDVFAKTRHEIMDNQNVDPHVREIFEKYESTGKISLADYEDLRKMNKGEWQVGWDKEGNPEFGRVSLPPAVEKTIGFIESARRKFNGRLDLTPAELNDLKITRNKATPPRELMKQATESDKSAVSTIHNHSTGLRRLIDEVTDDGTGRSAVTEMNREYANLAAIREAMENIKVSKFKDSVLASVVMAGGASAGATTITAGAGGLLALGLGLPFGAGALAGGAAGLPISAFAARAVRDTFTGPTVGAKFAGATKMRASWTGRREPKMTRPGKPAGPPPSGQTTLPPSPPSITMGSTGVPTRPVKGKGGKPAAAPPPAGTTAQSPDSKGQPIRRAQEEARTKHPDLVPAADEAMKLAKKYHWKQLDALWTEHGEKLAKSGVLTERQVKWIKERIETGKKSFATREAARKAAVDKGEIDQIIERDRAAKKAEAEKKKAVAEAKKAEKAAQKAARNRPPAPPPDTPDPNAPVDPNAAVNVKDVVEGRVRPAPKKKTEPAVEAPELDAAGQPIRDPLNINNLNRQQLTSAVRRLKEAKANPKKKKPDAWYDERIALHEKALAKRTNDPAPAPESEKAPDLTKSAEEVLDKEFVDQDFEKILAEQGLGDIDGEVLAQPDTKKKTTKTRRPAAAPPKSEPAPTGKLARDQKIAKVKELIESGDDAGAERLIDEMELEDKMSDVEATSEPEPEKKPRKPRKPAAKPETHGQTAVDSPKKDPEVIAQSSDRKWQKLRHYNGLQSGGVGYVDGAAVHITNIMEKNGVVTVYTSAGSFPADRVKPKKS